MKINYKNIKKAIALAISISFFALYFPAEISADSLTTASDTLETSQPSTESIHTLIFRVPTGLAGTSGGGNDEIRVSFEADFTMGSLAASDVSVETGGTGSTPSWSAYTTGTVVVNAQLVTIPLGTADIATTTWVKVTVGATNKVTNPSGSVCGTGDDSNVCTVAVSTTDGGGTPTYDAINLKVAIVSGVSITAQIDTTLSFSISAGTCTSGTVTASSVDFATIIPDTAETCTQTLSVSTNASTGYTTTTIANAQLTSGSNNIDWFSGTNASPTTWESPTSTTPNTNTGFLGYNTNDTTLGTGTADRFSGTKYAGWDTSTAYEVSYNSGPVSNEQTTVTYQIEVNTSQPTGNYSGTTITYVSTPIF